MTHHKTSDSFPELTVIGIVYLGRKGAGLELTRWMIQHYEEEMQLCYSYVSSDATVPIKLESRPESVVSFRTFDSIKEIIVTPLRPFKVANQIQGHILEHKVNTVIFTMPHIWDLIILYKLRNLPIKVVSMIHDDKAHRGEIFPPSWFIKKILRSSDAIIFFSHFVKRQLGLEKKEQFVCSLPSLIESTKYPQPLIDKKGLLFIGRIKKYKGISTLMDAYRLLPEPRTELTIAGFGQINLDLDSNVIFINRWLDDSEIIQRLNECEVLVLPYLEATQSGIIPIAMSLNTKIVYSIVGGLSEQLLPYSRKVGVTPASPESLAAGIQRAISNEFDSQVFSEILQLPTALEEITKSKRKK
jgi:glycosyltransferase involved in cell wall biosynthesis